ncbi:upf0193 protein evg1-like [Plakobranchus ocellatus]|uniref:Upf0193 protein evg1-like n=1 Tax=Plakobranchus ocellatus TaxID=259542 RepID=A0AAV4BYA1_9GAST|nr:upf0193 protein evg1-like [Plakobranchus ocellatus]
MSGQGGFWNAPQVVYSKQTHDLLKDMMRESKLTTFQQRHLEKTLRGGGQLPARVPPTTSKLDHRKAKAQAPQPKVLNPKVYSGGVRSKNTMERMGAFEKPEYIPPRGVTRSAREKEKLANIMAYGEDQPRIPMKNIRVRLEPLSPLPDRFDELQKEIKDRQDFLKEMESIGKGEQYRVIIATEISQKVREMELIDKKRSLELQHMIEEDEKKKKQQARTSSGAIPKPDVM